jgi:hypothetical protein
MLTGVLPENMDHHVAEIHEHPGRRDLAFNAQGVGSGLGENTVNVIGNRSGLPIRFCRSDDQIIGYGCQFSNMENKNVRRLLVEHGLRNSEGCGLRCPCDRGPLVYISDDEVYKIPQWAATDLPRIGLL